MRVYEKKYPEFLSLTEFFRFVELKDFSVRTMQSNLAHVAGISRHSQLCSAFLSEREVADFLLVHHTARKLSQPSIAQMPTGLLIIFRNHIGRDWVSWKTIQVRRSESLPWALSREKVESVIVADKLMRFRPLFTLIFHCALRPGDAIKFTPTGIDAEAM